MRKNALSIAGLQKRYASGTEALKRVSLTVSRGDFFALLGPNGAGQTTLIGIVTGLVTKTSGTVHVFDFDIEKKPEKTRMALGLCGQEVNFNPFEKPLDILVNQAGYYGISRRAGPPPAPKTPPPPRAAR